MDEKDKSPPEGDIVLSRLDSSSIAIEEAETDIKEAAKDAVLKNSGKIAYLGKVNEILKKSLARVRSPTLKDAAIVSLLRFAKKQYDDELNLMKLYAEWFKALSEAKAKGLPRATRMYRAMIEEVGSVRESIGFRLAVLEDSTELTVLMRPDTTSEELRGSGAPADTYDTALPLGELHDRYLERVEAAKLALIESDAVDDTGFSLRSIAEMTVRYNHQQDMITNLRADGVDLVYIEPHANCSKRCEKYQVGGSKHPSGLYSLNGSTGITPEDHVKYVPLEFATNNPDDRYVTSKGKIYQNGCILGYNCRHRLIPYKPYTQPIPIPADVIENRREVETNQREMEREIRFLRGKRLQATSREEKNKLKLIIDRAVEKYKNYSLENKMAYYIRRTEIF